MNHKLFDSKRIANGYANDRPWLHKFVIEQIQAEFANKIPFENGLDVGCGAGLSVRALKLICNKVTGTDIFRRDGSNLPNPICHFWAHILYSQS